MGNLNDSEDINRTWENIKEMNPLNAELNPVCHLLALLGAHHILHVSGLRVNRNLTEDSLDLYELKQHKPWFDKKKCPRIFMKGSRLKCSGFRIQTKTI